MVKLKKKHVKCDSSIFKTEMSVPIFVINITMKFVVSFDYKSLFLNMIKLDWKWLFVEATIHQDMNSVEYIINIPNRYLINVSFSQTNIFKLHENATIVVVLLKTALILCNLWPHSKSSSVNFFVIYFYSILYFNYSPILDIITIVF